MVMNYAFNICNILFPLFILITPSSSKKFDTRGSRSSNDIIHPLSFSQLTIATINDQIFTSSSSSSSIQGDDTTISSSKDDASTSSHLDIISMLLHAAESNSKLLLENVSHKLNYEIFQGRSSLRGLSLPFSNLISYIQQQQQRQHQQQNGRSDASTTTNTSTSTSTSTSTLSILLLLLQQKLDVAHELILGVTMDNIHKAEYAATHPGKTSWSSDHPLSTMDDILHCIIHRFEGTNISVEGGGRVNGYENAKYWLAGGDKNLKNLNNNENDYDNDNDNTPEKHELWTFMKEYVTLHRNKFNCLDLVVGLVTKKEMNQKRTYSIIASGGKKRDVHVNVGMWDEFRFIDLCALRYGEYGEYGSSLPHDEGIAAKFGIHENAHFCELVDELQLVQLQFLLRMALKQFCSNVIS